MGLEQYMIDTAQGLADMLKRGKIRRIEQGSMTEAERGWSVLRCAA